MLGSIDFVQCIRDNLKGRHFEKKRGDAIVKQFETRQKNYVGQGIDPTTAGARAMKDIWTNMSFDTTERAKRMGKTLGVQLDNKARVDDAMNIDVQMFTKADLPGQGGQAGPRGSRGKALARAATASVEADPRLGQHKNYNTTKHAIRGQLFAMFEDSLEHFNKGAFGVQRGKASLPNIVREVFGTNTGDVAAKEFADSWMRAQETAVDLFNAKGGSMRKLARYMPQAMTAAKVAKAGLPRFKRVMEGALDWGKMHYPDGTAIPLADHDSVLEHVFETITNNGANKLDPAAFRGNGHALGNQLNQHRFLVMKGADAWLQTHAEFGDGSIFDTFVHHLSDMAHQIAMVDVYGPNPQAGFANLRAEIMKRAATISGKAVTDAEGVLKNIAEPMFEAVSRQNPMDPESLLGAGVTTTSNVLMAAQLGSATLLAAPGDFMQSASVRALHHMGLFDGVDTYLKTVAGSADQKALMLQSGVVSDEAISSVYGTTRFSGLSTYGPALSRRIADTVMRANLLQGHTTAARWTLQSELMGLMHRSKATAFQDLEFRNFLQMGGVDAAAWDAFRAMPSFNYKGADFLRPIDILKSNKGDKQALFQKFQGMMIDFSRTGVPDATIEAAVALKGTSRADTVPGALLHSFGMYKNFPMSFMMIYGRLAMTQQNALGRLGFLAGLGTAMTLVGALGTQMREISQGRDAMPMNTPQFMGKALMAGGGMGIWGDFLFGGVNQYGGGPQDMLAGPLAGFVGDTTQLVLGDAFQWAALAGHLNPDGEFKSTTGGKAVEWVKRYGPGTSLWYARLVLQREVFDRLSELADPRAAQKRKAQAQAQQRTYGNGYWWAPGQRTPSRAPSIFGNGP